jgi:hypothetical protein
MVAMESRIQVLAIRTLVERYIVVASDDDLGSMRQFAEKVRQRHNVLWQADVGEVTGMHQNVTIGNLTHMLMQRVRVTDANHSHSSRVFGWQRHVWRFDCHWHDLHAGQSLVDADNAACSVCDNRCTGSCRGGGGGRRCWLPE